MQFTKLSFGGFEDCTQNAANQVKIADSVEGGRNVNEIDINKWYEVDCKLHSRI